MGGGWAEVRGYRATMGSKSNFTAWVGTDLRLNISYARFKNNLKKKHFLRINGLTCSLLT